MQLYYCESASSARMRMTSGAWSSASGQELIIGKVVVVSLDTKVSCLDACKDWLVALRSRYQAFSNNLQSIVNLDDNKEIDLKNQRSEKESTSGLQGDTCEKIFLPAKKFECPCD